jgi:chitin disaccharide deacetylase
VAVAERLAPGLIVNADDLGIHPRINAGILSAYRSGILTSATMLVTTPYLEETIIEVVRPALLPIGVHLSLTLGQAVAPQREVSDLVDERGEFTWSARRLLLCSFAGEKERLLLAQIRREFEAQLGLARDCGLRPAHVDSHQHVHMHPAIFPLLEELLPRYGIKRLRFSRERLSHGTVAALLRRGKYINLHKVALLRWLSRNVRPRLETTDAFFGVLMSGVITLAALRAVVAGLPPDRSLEIGIHPGFPAARGETAYSLAYVNEFISAPERQMEHDALIDPEIAALVQRRGLVLRAFDGREKAA